MYLTKTPKFIKKLFPNYIWSVPTNKKTIFLTFDDGPIPEVTPWVLDTLKQFDAKASFFCVGENVLRYPEIYDRIIKEGHITGNHTFNHLSGWNTDNVPYFHNVRHCANLVNSDLFRPPYGKLKPKQSQFIQRHYQIVMWDVLSGDFDPNISKEQCLENVLQNTSKGSVIVFHDSIKAEDKLRYVLPQVLKFYFDKGFSFQKLPTQNQIEKNIFKKIA